VIRRLFTGRIAPVQFLGQFWECNLLPLPVTQRCRDCDSSLVAMRMVTSGIDGSKAGHWTMIRNVGLCSLIAIK
jgi:hypothetical protein